MPTNRKHDLIIGVLLAVSAGIGCAVVPLQAGRVDAVFHYRQTYELAGLAQHDRGEQYFGQRLLMAVLGRKNYCATSRDHRDRYLHSLFTNHWRVRGSATAVLSPSPWWSDGIIFEEQGHYVITDDEFKALARSEFYVEKQSVDDVKMLLGDRQEHAGDDRDLRWIDLLIRQIVVREAEVGEADRRFVYESALVLRLYIIPLDASGVFAIAPVRHEIGIVSQREPDDVYSVGCVSFDEPMDGRKIFDVRKRDSIFRVKDYPGLLRNAGMQPQTTLFRPRWHGQACARDQAAPYRASFQRSAREWGDDPDGAVFKRLFEEPVCS